MSDLNEKLDNLGKKIETRGQVNDVHLPSWPDAKRGTPNSFLRSALFSAVQSKDRLNLKEAVLASQNGVSVKYTGEQLNQEDLALWENLVHLAKEKPLGNVCDLTAYEILKALGLSDGAENYKTLHSGIIRLTACAVQITHDGRTFFGPLIEGGVKDDATNHYVINLNKNLIKLYGATSWTAIDWPQRVQIGKKPLAQALHAYYSTHKEPYPVKLATLHKLTGSRNKQPADFKRKIVVALSELVKIGFLKDYNIDSGLVTVKRSDVR